MTSNKNKLLLAEKLGLSEEENVLRKAAEFERLLELKNTPGLKLTDTSKLVICLDLAAECLGIYIDKVSVVKYSGLRSTVYLNYRKTVHNLLQLNTNKLTIKDLCRLLQCNTHIQNKALDLLKAYHCESKMEIDVDSPQYICMAVYQACRLCKEKVSKSKLVQKSELRPAQWAKLEESWSLFFKQHSAYKNQCKEQIETDVPDSTLIENGQTESTKKVKREAEIVPYEEWERKVIDKALSHLREQLLNDEISFQDYMKEYRECVDDEFHSSILKELNKKDENTHSKVPRSPQKRTKELCDAIPKIVVTESSPKKSPRKNYCKEILSPKNDNVQKKSTTVSVRQSPRKRNQNLSDVESLSAKFANYLCSDISPRKRVSKSSEEFVLSFRRASKKFNL